MDQTTMLLVSLFGFFFAIQLLRQRIAQNDRDESTSRETSCDLSLRHSVTQNDYEGPTSREILRDLARTSNRIQRDLEQRLGPDYEVIVNFKINR